MIIRTGTGSIRAWCAACSMDVEMLTPDDAVLVFPFSTRAIYSSVETEKIHFIETKSRSILVCVNSLSELSRNPDQHNYVARKG